jgi:hypothetical protein
MPNLFQPSDAKGTIQGGPSQAIIALLTAILDAAGAQPKPTFKGFVGGARMPQIPPGLGTMLRGLGPNAFRSTKTISQRPSAPGAISDIASVLGLLALLGGSRGGALGSVEKGIGGAKSLWDLLAGTAGGGDVGADAFLNDPALLNLLSDPNAMNLESAGGPASTQDWSLYDLFS